MNLVKIFNDLTRDYHRVKMIPFIELKNDLRLEDILLIDPRLLEVLAFIAAFMARHQMPFVITSMIRTPKQDVKLGARSTTHQDGRAFDFSLRGIDDNIIERLLVEADDRFPNYGAISYTTGRRRLIYIHENHDGDGVHAHVQVDRGGLYALRGEER